MDNKMIRDEDCPLPYIDFNKFCEYQSDMLLKETDMFFNNHNLRLKKYFLPVKLPDWAKSFSDVLDTGEEYEPLTTIYRHKHFLKCRVLHNYSYIETRWNRSNDPRNKNIPFDLRPLTTEILNQLDIIDEDILDPEFSGLLITLNTHPYHNEDKPSSGEVQGNENHLNNNVNGVEKVNGVKENGTVCEKKPKYSKIICGALIECLITNERCIKSIWFHPNLSKHSSRLVLQNFLPRLMYEIFQLPSVIDESGKVSKFNKFTYIMHNDLDLFPRQCWLLFASIKKMSLPRHYEPSTFEDHPVSLVYGECHTDEVGYLKLREENGNANENVTDANTPLSEDDDMTFNKSKLIHLDDYNIDLLNVQLNHSSMSRSSSMDETSNSKELVNGSVSSVNNSDKDMTDETIVSNGINNGAHETNGALINGVGNANDIDGNINGVSNVDELKDRRYVNCSATADNKNKRNERSLSGMSYEVPDNTKSRLIKLLNSDPRINSLYKVFISVGSVNSTRNVSCTCRREKLKKNVDDQAWLDRLVGCSENYMYLMLPKRVERPRLGLLNRDGWRDLLITYVDNVLLHDLNKLLPDYLQTEYNLNTNINYNNNTEEWCQLKREDLIDVTSDTEVYMRLPDNYNN
ncbi:hypothetical protein TpMuguga_01g00648 [Theileria parva strain Muguga]|uniref:Uncharacterized protein n=1 Tax=Theileria parva TaxID=5875 RepID=Q4N822_THEPA|nr:uncharacterized protein TpMuguga_01g00648 [Theileria parva strain Muguga]EAN33886.1 hypothetical protein TpMuguga_01g00648 [Theileria parva strain Muguga]|eukprot:XP_766169.1 hypothetical protein [Theileria parva strain Muguga]